MPPLLGPASVIVSPVGPSLPTETPIDDWHPIPLHRLTQFVGGPESGKSLLLRELLLASINLKNEEAGRVFYASAHDPVMKLPSIQKVTHLWNSDLEETADKLFRFFGVGHSDIVLIDDAQDFSVSSSEPGSRARTWGEILRKFQDRRVTVVLTGRSKEAHLRVSKLNVVGTAGSYMVAVTIELDPVATTQDGLVVELLLKKSHQRPVSTYAPLRLWIEPDQTPSVFLT